MSWFDYLQSLDKESLREQLFLAERSGEGFRGMATILIEDARDAGIKLPRSAAASVLEGIAKNDPEPKRAIQLRVSRFDVLAIDQAAANAGENRSEYMIRCATNAAQKQGAGVGDKIRKLLKENGL